MLISYRTPRPPVKALDPRRYGFAFDPTNLDSAFISDVHPSQPTLPDTKHVYDPNGIFYVAGAGQWTINEITQRLQDGVLALTSLEHSFLQSAVYSRHLGFEFMHLPNKHEREWIAKKLETLHAEPSSPSERVRQWKLLEASEAFDRFLHKRFPSVKRYGLQGAESMMIALERIFAYASRDGVSSAVLVMPHRGRLNVLAQLLDFDVRLMAHKVRSPHVA